VTWERPENELLVSLARVSLTGAKSERVRELLSNNLDWDYLIATADHHNVLPLVYRQLVAQATSVSADALSQLKNLNQENTRQSLLLTGELCKVLDLLAAHDVPAIPFKGPTLGVLAYGDVGLRQFSDLDILVRKQDVLNVKDLLLAEGFKPTQRLTNSQEAALLRFDCAYNFTSKKNAVFDVHWDFAAPHFSFPVDVSRSWSCLQTVTIGGKQFSTLRAEDLLLVLCFHGFTHSWERLGWVCDVAGLIDRRRDFDWPLVLDKATRHGCRRILWLGIVLASELLEASVPTDVLQTAQSDPMVNRIIENVQERLFAPEPVSSGMLNEALVQLRMRERGRDKLMSGFRLATAPRSYDWMFLTLPRWLFFLYYPLRPLRLAGKYGARLLGSSNLVDSG